jgi:hypothetical protein
MDNGHAIYGPIDVKFDVDTLEILYDRVDTFLHETVPDIRADMLDGFDL